MLNPIIDNSDDARLNNYELASVNLRPYLDYISRYTNYHLTAQPKQDKIKRQIKALQSIIKN